MAEKLSDFLEKTPTPQPYIISRGLLPVGGKCIIAGSPKANKSFVALNLLLDIVRGRPVFGAHYKNGAPVMPINRPWRALYLEQELGEEGLLERLRGKNGQPGLMTGIEAKGLELYVKTKDMAMRLDLPDGRAFIEKEIAAVRPDVVIADPLSKFNLQDENSAQQMGMVCRVIDHIVDDHRCAFVVIHHISKQDPDPKRQRRGGDRLRGSSALFADVDTLIEVTRTSSEKTPEPTLKLSFELRRGEPLEDLFVRRFRDGHIELLGEQYQQELTPSYPEL